MLPDHIEKNKNLAALSRITLGLLNFGFVVWNVTFSKVKSDLISFLCNLTFPKTYDDFGARVRKTSEANHVFYTSAREVPWDYPRLTRQATAMLRMAFLS